MFIKILNLLAILATIIYEVKVISKLYDFRKNNGYKDEIICYIKKPLVANSKAVKISNHVASISFAAGLIYVWTNIIVSVVILGFSNSNSYILLILIYVLNIWYKLYSEMNGSGIIEIGIIHGNNLLKWKEIKNLELIKRKRKRIYIKISKVSRLLPIYIKVQDNEVETVSRVIQGRFVDSVI